MEDREPVRKNHYLAVTLAWYLSTVPSGFLAALLITHNHTGGTGLTITALEIGAAVLTILAIISPAAVALTLRRMRDPAAGMTASAVLMLSHILIMSGPFVLLTPIIGRYLAVQRHNSGGY